METLYRLVSGAAAGIAALFAPIGPLVACAVVFIGIDFLSGVAASRAAARRYVGRFTGEPELCAPADGRNGELVFQQPDVPVAVAKDRRGDLYTIQFNVLFCHVLLLMCLLR